MSLSAGTKLGPVRDPLAAWRRRHGRGLQGRDSRLDRIVSIKVFNLRIVAGTDMHERFEREACVISQLSHPHVCALFDVGDAPVDSPATSHPPRRVSW